MRPDASVLLLTTLIGVGQGLFLALFTVQLYALAGLLPSPSGHAFYAHGSLVALVFLGGGLAASFFHLGRPERAWRTRRDVAHVVAVARGDRAAGVHGHRVPVRRRAPDGLEAGAGDAAVGLAIDTTLVLGTIGTVLAFALFVCTAMIYACLPFLREWASPLTVVNYTLLGGASGFALAAAFAAIVAPELTRFLAGWAFVITLLGAASRIASLIRNGRLKPKSTVQTAIGIKHPRIVQKSMGFMGGSFNTREFFHGRSAASCGPSNGCSCWPPLPCRWRCSRWAGTARRRACWSRHSSCST